MHILQSFRVGDSLYTLCDDTANNDDRTVCKAGSLAPVLLFDSSCNVRDPSRDNQRIAGIRSQDGRYGMTYRGQPCDLGPGSWETSWRHLMAAEVAAAKIILPTLD